MGVDRKEQFIKVLDIELEDLKMDIEMMIREAEKAKVTEKITNYVFMENLVVFRDEIAAVESLKSFIDASCLQNSCSDLADLKNSVMGQFRRRLQELKMPHIMGEWLDRKVEKAYQYIIQWRKGEISRGVSPFF